MTLRTKTNLFSWFVFLLLLQHMNTAPVMKKHVYKMAGPLKTNMHRNHPG
ncbi:MAG: hypothetical protein ACJ76H_07965 [Bacteriovoracaceae bacterium]